MSTTSTPAPDDGSVPLEELRRQAAHPLPPLAEVVWNDPFSSDEQYAQFLEDLDRSRRRS